MLSGEHAQGEIDRRTMIFEEKAKAGKCLLLSQLPADAPEDGT